VSLGPGGRSDPERGRSRRSRSLKPIPFEYFDFVYTGAMSTQASESTTVLPPADMEAMLDLSRFLEHVSEPAALLGPDGQAVPLPMEAYKVLVKVVASMRAGKAITIAPLDQQLTTQEAANFLGISRPTLVKLLDHGEISFERPASGRHRRVRLDDVLDYQRRKRASRRATLDELTEQAAAAGLYDQVPDYTEALQAARERQAG
jgi:excisionase family DNA binding protein